MAEYRPFLLPVKVDPTLPDWTLRFVGADGSTVDMDVSPSPADLRRLVGDVDWPCTWAHLFGNVAGPGTPYRKPECERPAVWRVKWRERCASGVEFPESAARGSELTLCNPHFMYIADFSTRRRRGDILHCAACMCEVVNMAHVLDSWYRIR